MPQTLTLTFALLLAAARNFRRLVPSNLILLATEYDFENGASFQRSEKLTRDSLFRELATRGFFREQTIESLAAAKTFSDIEALALDVFESEGFQPHALVTPEEAETRRRERERARLEVKAREIAIRHNATMGTLDFIRACHKELRRFRDYREGMREDGLCMGFGVTSSQWFDEFNASTGDSAEVSDVLAWLETECPLLCAQVREAEARGESLLEGSEE